MENMHVTIKEERENGWTFLVEVGEEQNATQHSVTLEKNYYEELTGKRISPQELIQRSFEFLLKREPKESILREFNTRVISQYFSEYEEEIQKRCA